MPEVYALDGLRTGANLPLRTPWETRENAGTGGDSGSSCISVVPARIHGYTIDPGPTLMDAYQLRARL